MSSTAARSAVAPLYLLASLVLGGSAQGIWQNMVLQLAGLAIIAWAAASPSAEPLPKPVRLLFLLTIAAILIVVLQQVPLPAAWWASGRPHLAAGYRLLGQPLPPLPISLTPYGSLSTLLGLIPPLAMFAAIVRLKALRPSWLAAALLGGAIAGISLGALQVASVGLNSPWYLYAKINAGSAVGFFANANHMANLLLIALPFLAAIGAVGRSRNIQLHSVLMSVLIGLALVLLAGIALNGSLAGYAFALPVLAACSLIILPRASRFRRWAALVAVLSTLGALAVLANSAIGSSKIGQQASTAVPSRAIILETTGKAIADHMPLGTGLGSFAKVYRLYESPEVVTGENIIHAHNDYAELALELGVPGIIVMLLFLAWWLAAVRAVWRRDEGGPFARAASIASAVLLADSLMDFPLRTAAISVSFAMCLALLADRRTPRREEASDLRPARHLVFR